MNPEAPQAAKMRPCCLAVSTNTSLGKSGDEAHRRWRALSLDNQAVLAAGELIANDDAPLALLRERATTAAREQGYDPQEFILEDETPDTPKH